jgi:hypothetical protein
MAFTIKEIGDLAGVTTRTIRYYDEIGLLRPAITGDNVSAIKTTIACSGCSRSCFFES